MMLWRIGEENGETGAFALGPDGWKEFARRFKEDPVFIIGRSDAKKDWPYVHPAPRDEWAGGERHAFTILFGLKEAPAGGTSRLVVSLADTHEKIPPRLKIEVNGLSFEHKTPKGGPDDSISGDPSKGRTYRFAVDLPQAALMKGNNRILITTMSGSWMIYDWVGLEVPSILEWAPVEPKVTICSINGGYPLVKEKGEKLFQAVPVTILNTGDAIEAWVSGAGGEKVKTGLKPGQNIVELFVPAVKEEGEHSFEVEVKGQTVAQQKAKVEPVRPWQIHLLPHSHVDIGYTHVQGEVEEFQCSFIDESLALAEKTKNHPPESRFKWNTEVMWAVDSYMRTRPEEKKARFIEAVKDGSIGLDALYGHELTGLCRPEELMELVGFARRFSKEYGVVIDGAMLTDVPNCTWGLVPALALNGVKYLSSGPNANHRLGGIYTAWADKPFYWLSPCGQHMLLYWMTGEGYAFFHKWMYGRIQKAGKRAFMEYLQKLRESDYPYDIVHLRYSIDGDNGPPDPELSDFVRQWNEKYVTPKLTISTTGEALRAFEERHGDQLPIVSGDFTPYWEDGAASSSEETGINRAAAERLVQAETLWALVDREHFPHDEFDNAWRNIVLYDEHTWGAYNSIDEPECDFVKKQWSVKRAFALDGDRASRALLEKIKAGCGSGGPAPAAVHVFNTNSWARKDLVVVPEDWKTVGDLVHGPDGEPVPSQRLSSGEFVFLAEKVPPLGSAVYTFHEGEYAGSGAAKVDGRTLSNSDLEVVLDEKTGTIRSLRHKEVAADFVDTESGGLNEYCYVAGRDPKNLKRSGRARITVKEKGPLVASLLVECEAPGCRKILREIRLFAGLDRVDIIDTIHKELIYEPEGVHIAFPFSVPEGESRMDIAWGVVRAEEDQLPGSCKNFFTVQRWVDISNEKYGVTLAVVDAPLVEVGGIAADPVSCGWLETLKPSTAIYSYAMNNYWETNYKAGQEGPICFRYSIRPHPGAFDAAAAARFGTGRSQPFIAVPAEKETAFREPLFRLDSKGVVVTSLRPSRDGRALMVRLFNAGEKEETVLLEWRAPAPEKIWISSPMEEETDESEGAIPMAPYEIVTLKVLL